MNLTLAENPSTLSLLGMSTDKGVAKYLLSTFFQFVWDCRPPSFPPHFSQMLTMFVIFLLQTPDRFFLKNVIFFLHKECKVCKVYQYWHLLTLTGIWLHLMINWLQKNWGIYLVDFPRVKDSWIKYWTLLACCPTAATWAWCVWFCLWLRSPWPAPSTWPSP